jgi:hypothetical protein
VTGNQVDVVGLAARNLDGIIGSGDAQVDPGQSGTLRDRIWRELEQTTVDPVVMSDGDAWHAWVTACAEIGRDDPLTVARDAVHARNDTAIAKTGMADVPADPWAVRRCPGCGCTDTEACAEGCHAVDHPVHGTICSQCATRADALARSTPAAADPYRALVVVAVELPAGDQRDPWTPARVAGYVERLVAGGAHVRSVNVTAAQDGRVISFQDGHGGADLPWRGQWGGPEKDTPTDPFLDGQTTGINEGADPGPTRFVATNDVVNVCGFCSGQIIGTRTGSIVTNWRHTEQPTEHPATPANLQAPPPEAAEPTGEPHDPVTTDDYQAGYGAPAVVDGGDTPGWNPITDEPPF